MQPCCMLTQLKYSVTAMFAPNLHLTAFVTTPSIRGPTFVSMYQVRWPAVFLCDSNCCMQVELLAPPCLLGECCLLAEEMAEMAYRPTTLR